MDSVTSNRTDEPTSVNEIERESCKGERYGRICQSLAAVVRCVVMLLVIS